ncbi:MAG TPA: hypothetical protein VHE12_03510 [bacterium]|nr:hypothetical protein [bacterium]
MRIKPKDRSSHKKVILPAALGLLSLAGCVSIYDSKVQVERPAAVESYNNRSPLDRCAPHVYPHRLIQATAGGGYPYLNAGGALIDTQEQFDQWWAGLSVQLDQDKVVTDNLKPLIDWSKQSVYMIPLTLNPCEKVKPFGDGMSTDCYTITIPIYRWTDEENCQKNSANIPVFIYIYPKAVGQPVSMEWHYPTPTPTVVPASK